VKFLAQNYMKNVPVGRVLVFRVLAWSGCPVPLALAHILLPIVSCFQLSVCVFLLYYLLLGDQVCVLLHTSCIVWHSVCSVNICRMKESLMWHTVPCRLEQKSQTYLMGWCQAFQIHQRSSLMYTFPRPCLRDHVYHKCKIINERLIWLQKLR
jgi:hypothetical protein